MKKIISLIYAPSLKTFFIAGITVIALPVSNNLTPFQSVTVVLKSLVMTSNSHCAKNGMEQIFFNLVHYCGCSVMDYK